MLELLPVSRFNIQQYNVIKKQKSLKKIIIEQTQFQQTDPAQQLKQQIIEKQKDYKERFFQNSNLTSFLHKRILITTYSIILLSISSMTISITQDTIYQFDRQMNTYVLIFHSINTLGIIILMIARYFQDLALKEKQLIKISIKKNWETIRLLTYQIIIITFHPNLLTKYLTIMVQQPINNTFIPLQINDVFQIVMLFRIYLIYYGIIQSSLYLSTRSSRVCRIYGTKHNLDFGMKALFHSSPLLVLLFIFLTQLITFGQMLKISERFIDQRFNDLGSCMWCIIITMSTVGYGDYSPVTYSGRIVVFLATISGIIMSSLLILTLSTYLSINSFENKSHITIQRVQLRTLLDEYSKQAVRLSTALLKKNERMKILYKSYKQHREIYNNISIKEQWNKNSIVLNLKQCFLRLKNIGKSEQDINNQFYQQLKKKTQQIKTTTRKIKSLVDTDNINEEMNRLFEVLQDNLKIIYTNQLQYGKLLITISQSKQMEIDKIKFTFTSQIDKIIKNI